MKRVPVAAGRFYPGDKSSLERNLETFCDKCSQKRDVIGCIVPHAGYVYSGKTAGKVISKLKVKDRVIILGPNHTGQGSAFSIYPTGQWQTPLGDVDIDEGLVDLLVKECSLLRKDSSAHHSEHSLEVEVPFLQYFNQAVKITPICLGGGSLSDWKKLGQSIAQVIKSHSLDVLVVASSDMSHYEPIAAAKRKDKIALDCIVDFDIDCLVESIQTHEISMCGYMPVSVLLSCAKELGAQKAEVVDYTTSADASGDESSVVGYAGVIVY